MKFNGAYAVRNIRYDAFDVYLSHLSPGKNTVDHVTSVIIQQSDIGVDLACDPPPIRLEREAAQSLMDDLWSSGLRPTHAKAGDDLIQALQAHVIDSNAVRDKLLDHFTKT